MRSLVIVCGLLAFGLAVGCKKDDAAAGTTGETTGAAATTGDTGKSGPATAPDIKADTGGTAGSTAGGAVSMASVAGTYDSIMDEATQAELDKAKQHFGGGTMKFNEDGTFEGNATIGEQKIQTKGTFTVEGTTVTTTATEINGEKNPNPVPQKYDVSSDGKELKAEGTGVTLKKQ